jgi:hypothetical protein
MDLLLMVVVYSVPVAFDVHWSDIALVHVEAFDKKIARWEITGKVLVIIVCTSTMILRLGAEEDVTMRTGVGKLLKFTLGESTGTRHHRFGTVFRASISC